MHLHCSSVLSLAGLRQIIATAGVATRRPIASCRFCPGSLFCGEPTLRATKVGVNRQRAVPGPDDHSVTLGFDDWNEPNYVMFGCDFHQGFTGVSVPCA